jgi:hypothetical protein
MPALHTARQLSANVTATIDATMAMKNVLRLRVRSI